MGNHSPKTPVEKRKPIRLNGVTERLLAANGWVCGSVESYNAHSGTSHDFLGVADFLAIHRSRRVAAIQVTTSANKSARFKKIINSSEAFYWVMSGGEFWILSWKLGKQVWEPTRYFINLIDFPLEFANKFDDFWELRAACARRDIDDHKLKTEFIEL